MMASNTFAFVLKIMMLSFFTPEVVFRVLLLLWLRLLAVSFQFWLGEQSMHPPDLQSLTLEGWTVLSSVGYPFSSFWGGAFGEDVFSGPIAPPFSNLFSSFFGFLFLSSPLCISRMSCWASRTRAFLCFFLLCHLRYLKKCSKYFFLHYHCFRHYILH